MDEQNFSQESKTSITEEIKNLEIYSSEIEATSSQTTVTEIEKKESECSEKRASSSSETTGSSSSISQEKSDIELIEQKKKRKRKRKRKKNGTTTTVPYSPDEPFTKRYKNITLDLKVPPMPKFHIKFDEEGNVDEKLSKYNYKPRVIKALEVNLTLNDTAKRKTNEMINTNNTQHISDQPCESKEVIISLKPRIIKAIEK